MGIKNIVYIITMFFSLTVNAQQKNKSIKVVDENGNAVAYVHAQSKSTARQFMTDNAGFLQIGTLEDVDTLTFQSSFYKQLSFNVAYLKKEIAIVLPTVETKIEDVVVVPTEYAYNLIKKASKIFAAKYSRNYISIMTFIRTIECNGRYREFFGYKGLLASLDFNQKQVSFHFNDANHLHRWLPLTIMRSHPWAATGNAILETCSVVPRSPRWNKEDLLIRYQDKPVETVLEMKRAIEIYSPLNPKQVNNFEYAIHEISDDKHITVIRFSTKPKAFLNKTKLFGNGYIYIDTDTKMVERIIMENHQDRLTMFPRWKLKSLAPSATQHRLEITYITKGQYIYTENVSLSVNWIDPMTEDRIYYIKSNSRRNPIRNGLHEYESVSFINMMDLDKEQTKYVKDRVLYDGFIVLSAPYIASEWQPSVCSQLDWSRLETELNINGISLYQQAIQNSDNFDFYKPPQMTEQTVVKEKHVLQNMGCEIYQKIYQKKYEPLQ